MLLLRALILPTFLLFFGASRVLADDEVFPTKPVEMPAPLVNRRFVLDCARYLKNAFVYAFHPFAKKIPEDFPWTVPKTKVRPLSEAADQAIRRHLSDLQPSEANAYSLMQYTSTWGIGPELRNDYLKTIEMREGYLHEQIASLPPDHLDRPYYQNELETCADLRASLYEPGSDLTANASLPPPTGTKTPIQRFPKKKKAEATPTGEEALGEAAIQTQNTVIDAVEKAVATLFPVGSRPRKLVEDTIDIVVAKKRRIMVGMTSQNSGIIGYLSRNIGNDPVWMSDALDFYSRLERIDRRASAWTRQKKGVTQLSDLKSPVDVWSLALETTEGDPFRAIRVISTFGHDDVANLLFQDGARHPAWINLLNVFAPPNTSFLHANGAVDGLTMSKGLGAKFRKLQEEGKKFIKPLDDVEDPMQHWFRSGNYHFIGGAFVTAELIIRGNDRILGERIPVLVSELLGTLYKRITMEASYLQGNEKALYLAGYPKKKVPRPAGMTEAEFERAKFGVRLNLLHLELTHEQHRIGAEWAYEILRDWATRAP